MKPNPSDLWNLDRAQTEEVSKMAKQGLESLFQFCIPSSNRQDPRFRTFGEGTLRIAMRRFVAVAWLLHSEMLVDDQLDEQGNPTGKLVPFTLEQLANLPQLDCTKCALSLLAKRFGEQFKFQSRVQKRQTSKPNYAKAAKTGWAKRRAREAVATA